MFVDGGAHLRSLLPESVSHLAFELRSSRCGGEGEGRRRTGGRGVHNGWSAGVAEEPGDAAFVDPSVLAKGGAGFDFFARYVWCDFLLTQPSAQLGNVVGLIGVEPGGPDVVMDLAVNAPRVWPHGAGSHSGPRSAGCARD